MEWYHLWKVEITETLQCWAYGIEVEIMLGRDDIRIIVTTIEMENMRNLNVIMRGRKPLCFWWLKAGHLKKDCEEYRRKMLDEDMKEESGETESNVHDTTEEKY